MKIYDSNSGIPVGGSQRSQETQQTDRAGAGRTSTYVFIFISASAAPGLAQRR